MTFPDLIPLLTMTNQFQIPAGFRAYCHICETPFPTLEKLHEHDKQDHKR